MIDDAREFADFTSKREVLGTYLFWLKRRMLVTNKKNKNTMSLEEIDKNLAHHVRYIMSRWTRKEIQSKGSVLRAYVKTHSSGSAQVLRSNRTRADFRKFYWHKSSSNNNDDEEAENNEMKRLVQYRKDNIFSRFSDDAPEWSQSVLPDCPDSDSDLTKELKQKVRQYYDSRFQNKNHLKKLGLKRDIRKQFHHTVEQCAIDNIRMRKLVGYHVTNIHVWNPVIFEEARRELYNESMNYAYDLHTEARFIESLRHQVKLGPMGWKTMKGEIVTV